MTEVHAARTATSLLDAFPGKDFSTLPDTDFVPEQVRISRRELSLIVERLLMAAGCQQGIWPGARDYVLETVAELGTRGIDVFEDALIEHASSPWPSVKLEAADMLVVDDGPMILVGNTVANALLAYLGDKPAGRFTARGLTSTEGVEGLHVRAAYHGFALAVDANANEGTITVTGRASESNKGSDPVQLLRSGLEMSGAQWWRIYRPSNFALSEETEISRSHTGVSETLLHYTV